MTEDHRALISRLERAAVTGCFYGPLSGSDLQSLLTLAQAAEGLVEALQEARGYLVWPEFSRDADSIAKRAERALSAYTAATQPTKPGAADPSALSTSTPGEAGSVAEGPKTTVCKLSPKECPRKRCREERICIFNAHQSAQKQ